ncbi:methionyl-tRNA formyltransferase [Metabacillus fastidiosus]|uniref:Methionyl-tRNA formyltransferase n=1 Tax=Metabacillus fastidiosus TaxID=1458 RepID=A0ABU6NWW6_9BACI|nr:methionyl-tRNA formyltransferase [Metabacillus fastidiosus]MED4401610.1 methionyl-tRNA formyltransferase [Metabacillus fastidiosus]MED4452831.1 methionyl-tRNA formyltransferase [Metabacillus fastidiosus]
MTRIIFMGTPDFSVPVLQKLIDDQYNIVGVVTQPDRPKGRKKVLTPPPVKVEAEKHGLPVLQPEKIREKEELDKIFALEPDLIVTAAFGQILPKELLDAPKLGCINVHASLLPELRGGAPVHYSIMQGKAKTGITIMYMAEKLDAGDILTQVEVAIDERDDVGILFDKLSIAGAKLLSETVPLLLEGKITPVKQDEEKATFAYTIKREQEKINWAKTGEEIYNHIRGLCPWPVAFTTLDGQVMKVWWGEKVKTEEKAEPGTVIGFEKDGFIVATGNETAIKVTELQPAGKKKMKGEDYLRGQALQIGSILGL